MNDHSSLNVFGNPLQPCCDGTGVYRNGSCHVPASDIGNHSVCAIVTDAFLQQQASLGNDLITPMPQYNFPGLKNGDKWCVCASRWLQAYNAGIAPKVVLAATNQAALKVIPIDALKAHAI